MAVGDIKKDPSSQIENPSPGKGAATTTETVPESQPTQTKGLHLYDLPPEILGIVLSHLPLLDYFHLKLAGSRYVTSVVRQYPRFHRFSYSGEIRMEDRKRLGRVRSLMEIMVSRGQTTLLAELMDGALPGERRTAKSDQIAAAFLFAARYGTMAILNTLVSGKWVELDVRNGQGMTALHLASKYGHVAAVKFLLRAGAPVNLRAHDRNHSTALHLASESGHRAVAELLVLKGVNNRQRNLAGETALHLAARHGHTDVIQVLPAVGLDDWMQKSSCGKSAFQYATERGHHAVVKLFLEHRDTMRFRKSHPDEARKAFFLAAQSGFHEIVCLLLGIFNGAESKRAFCYMAMKMAAENGRDTVIQALFEILSKVGARKNYLVEPLHVAACKGQEKTVSLLLDLGALVDARDKDVRTALHHVVAERSSFESLTPIIDLLLARGADLHAEFDGQTPLHIAIRSAPVWASGWDKGRVMMVKYLLDKGANLHAKDARGNTPLHVAVESECRWSSKCQCPNTAAQTKTSHITTTLLDRGADVHARNYAGQTPLHVHRSVNACILSILLERGAHLETPDHNGQTALHLRVKQGYTHGVKLLLQRGSNPNAQDIAGMTPLHFAVILGRHDLARMLLEHGANVNCQDRKMRSPLHHATKICGPYLDRQRTWSLLISKGADKSLKDHRGRTATTVACEIGQRPPWRP